MVFLTKGEIFAFVVPEELANRDQDVTAIISRRLAEISADYRLTGTEKITEILSIRVAGGFVDLSAQPGPYSDVELASNLLIYLKIFREIGIWATSTGAQLMYSEPLGSFSGILTISPGEADSVALVRVTAESRMERIVFTLEDLAWRDLIVCRESLTEVEGEALCRELDRRTEYFPPAWVAKSEGD